MLGRKKRLVENAKSSSPNPEKIMTPSQLTRNWATVGFFDACPTYESIRVPEPLPPSGGGSELPLISPKLKTRGFRRLTSLDFESEVVIEVGDVFEQIRRKHIRNGTKLLYQVIEIFPQSKSAIVQSVYGKEKKTFKELLDSSEYQMIVTEKTYSTKRTFHAQHSLRDPLLRDKVKYSGREGRDSLFSLFRQAPDEYQMTQKDPLSSPRPITPRLTYVFECRKYHIPPIPLLTRCFQDSYPVLDLSNQSIGGRYILPLAHSIGEMRFLREIDLTNNRLDSKSVLCLMRGIANSSIESVILNENKIGKLGVMGLQCLVSGEWNDLQSVENSSSSISSSSPCSASSSVSSTPSSHPSSVLPFSPIQKSRHSSVSTTSSFPLVHSSQSSVSSSLSTFSANLLDSLEPLPPLCLRKLSLKSCSLGDNLLSKLIQTLEFHCLTLRSLNLSSNSCSSFSISALSQLLGSNVVPLEFLDLSWNHLGTDHAITLIQSLSSNSTLKSLYLDYNGIHQGVLSLIATTGGMKVTGEEFMDSLKAPLSLSRAQTSGSGKGIVQLPSNQTIELISLTNNSIPTQILKQYQENFLTDLKLIQGMQTIFVS
jgi:hypothetical protein